MNMNLKSILTIMAISASTAVMSVWGYGKFVERQTAGIQEAGKLPVNYAGYFGNNNAPASTVDFTPAATSATPAVVHIKTKKSQEHYSQKSGWSFCFWLDCCFCRHHCRGPGRPDCHVGCVAG